MSLVVGANCGFVTAAPTADPTAGGVATQGTRATATRFTCPVGVATITQIGCWLNAAQLTANFEVGLYDNNATTSAPKNRLFVDNTNTKSAITGWNYVAVDWAVVSGTIYWAAIQDDGTSTIDRDAITGEIYEADVDSTTLITSWVVDTRLPNYVLAVYLLPGAVAGGTTHYLEGSISAVSYLTAVGWSVTRYASGSISAVGNLANAGMPITHYATGCISGVSYLTADLTKQATNINIISNISAAPYHTRDGSDGLLVKGGVEAQGGFYTDEGIGQTTSFVDNDRQTITTDKGIVISVSSAASPGAGAFTSVNASGGVAVVSNLHVANISATGTISGGAGIFTTISAGAGSFTSVNITGGAAVVSDLHVAAISATGTISGGAGVFSSISAGAGSFASVDASGAVVVGSALTVENGDVIIESAQPTIFLMETDNVNDNYKFSVAGGNLSLREINDDYTGSTARWRVDSSGNVMAGGTTDYNNSDASGNFTFAGAAGFYPRRITQTAIPASGTSATQIDVGEMLIWVDSDDGKVYFVYNDTTSGIKSVELLS